MKVKSQKSSLILIEIVIGILFFSISCAVCLSIMFKAKSISDSTKESNFATTNFQTVSSYLKYYNADFTKLSEKINGELKDDTITVFLDSLFKVCDKAECIYQYDISKVNNEEYTYKFYKSLDNQITFEGKIQYHIPILRGDIK
ncbi:MAG: hypothetical protein RSE93_02325 [Oscillospiraceae bacterium]